MKKLAVFVVSMGCAVSFGQVKTEYSKPAKKTTNAPIGGAPVSRAEAKKTFARVESLMTQVIGKVKWSKSAIPAGAGSVTRFEVAREFARIDTDIRSNYKMRLKPIAFEPARVRASGRDRELLSTLISKGLIAEFAPVAAGPKDTLTPLQFGDAVGYFTARAMELAHMPSSKWSPSLHR